MVGKIFNNLLDLEYQQLFKNKIRKSLFNFYKKLLIISKLSIWNKIQKSLFDILTPPISFYKKISYNSRSKLLKFNLKILVQLLIISKLSIWNKIRKSSFRKNSKRISPISFYKKISNNPRSKLSTFNSKILVQLLEKTFNNL